MGGDQEGTAGQFSSLQLNSLGKKEADRHRRAQFDDELAARISGEDVPVPVWVDIGESQHQRPLQEIQFRNRC